MSKSNPVSTTEVADNVEITETQVFQPQKMYELDSSLIAEEYFAPIDEQLPYAISDARGMILIPSDQVEASLWLDPPAEFKKFQIKGGEPFEAIAFTEIHASILAKSPPFWYYAKTDENRANNLVNKPVCWYNSPEGELVKTEFDNAPSGKKRPYNYAIKLQVVLLDADLIPLHQIPFSIKFRGTACWNVLPELKKFYNSADKLFAKMNGMQQRTAFDDRVHALFAPKITFGSEYVGKTDKSESIRITDITKPTTENLFEWCLAVKGAEDRKEMLWDMQRDYKGADANKLPAPIASLPANPTPELTGEADLPQLAPSDPDEDFENGKLF
jgi:hypothetical protein